MKYSSKLFRGDDGLYKSLSSSCSNYFEFGAGDSTVWMSFNTSASIRSVDTSHQHGNTVRSLVNRKVDLTVIDVGPLQDWGRPTGYSRREEFSKYIFSYSAGSDGTWPDLVLIDGRFRVACFLATIREAPEGTLILFDDFKSRSYYHLVQEWIKPVKYCGEQALFMVDTLDRSELDEEINRFTYVMD